MVNKLFMAVLNGNGPVLVWYREREREGERERDVDRRCLCSTSCMRAAAPLVLVYFYRSTNEVTRRKVQHAPLPPLSLSLSHCLTHRNAIQTKNWNYRICILNDVLNALHAIVIWFYYFHSCLSFFPFFILNPKRFFLQQPYSWTLFWTFSKFFAWKIWNNFSSINFKIAQPEIINSQKNCVRLRNEFE